MAASLASTGGSGVAGVVAGAVTSAIVDLLVTGRSPRGHHSPETVTIPSDEPVRT
jgi:hypothetical protein